MCNFDRTCLEAGSSSFYTQSCYRVQFGRKNLSTFRRRCFCRRNKLMTYSMIIDIYYPMEVSWIEHWRVVLNFLTKHFPNLPISTLSIVVGCWFKYLQKVLHAKFVVCYIVQIWHFWFIMRISLFTSNLHVAIK